tara:strand:- start:39 stop:209 length:171 start_codon:yes stop_codon:yes gene_type:complete
MSPEHLKQLRKLSKAFEQGTACHEQIRQLNDILALVNKNQPEPMLNQRPELHANKE